MLVIAAVGVPQIVPLLVPKFRPVGKGASISHEVMTPGPLSVAFSGKSLLRLPLVKTMVLG